MEDKITQKNISCVFTLTDSSTQGYPANKIGKIYLASGDRQLINQPIINLSRYYVFFDVPAGDYTLIIEKSDYYKEKKQNVTVPAIINITNLVNNAIQVQLDPDFKQ